MTASDERNQIDEEYLHRLHNIESELRQLRSDFVALHMKQEIMERVTAQDIAREVIKSSYAVVGVDINSPESVNALRNNLEFAGMLHKTARNSIFAFITTISGLVAAAIWLTASEFFNGHK